jgi:predicted esterase
MRASARTITDLLADEVDAGIPADRVVLMGFSQGSVVSCLAGLTSERKVAGIAVLSGYLPMHGKIASVRALARIP